MCKHFKDCNFLLQRVIAAPQVLFCSCRLDRKKVECIQGELVLCNYTEIYKKSLFVFTCKLWADSPSLLQSGSEWLLCPRSYSWWVDRRSGDMHSGRLIIYPYVITLKSRCWNLYSGWWKPPKDCLKHALRKWRDGAERQIVEKWRDERG